MADLVITAANVAQGSGIQRLTDYLAGETITAGQAVYQKAADSKFYRAKADTLADATLAGVALHGALAGQPLIVQTRGPLTLGATLVPGTFYYVSAATFGSICPVADLASGNFPAVVGYATSATVLYVFPIVPGVSLP